MSVGYRIFIDSISADRLIGHEKLESFSIEYVVKSAIPCQIQKHGWVTDIEKWISIKKIAFLLFKLLSLLNFLIKI